MRQWLLFFGLFASIFVHGQDSAKAQFMQVYIHPVSFTHGYYLDVEETDTGRSEEAIRISDEKGNRLIFYNLPAAIKWMDDKGWEIYVALPIWTQSAGPYRQHYKFLMRRKKATEK